MINTNDIETGNHLMLDNISKYVTNNTPSNTQFDIMEPQSIRVYMTNNTIVNPGTTVIFGVSYLNTTPRVVASLTERVMQAMRYVGYEIPVDLMNVYIISLSESETGVIFNEDADAKLIDIMDRTPIAILVREVSVFMDESTVGMENEVNVFGDLLGLVENMEEDEEQPGMVE